MRRFAAIWVWEASAIEALHTQLYSTKSVAHNINMELRIALYKCSTYLLTYLLKSRCQKRTEAKHESQPTYVGSTMSR